MVSRRYSQDDYDEATERISRLININEVRNVSELDRLLKRNEVYDDARGGEGTIYKQLIEKWKDFIKPPEKIRQERAVRKKRAMSSYAITKRRRELRRLQGINYFESEDRIKIRVTKAGARQYILHNKKYYRLDNIIISSRTVKKPGELTFKWYTRRKRITVKSARKR